MSLWLQSLVGGMLIGSAVTALLILNGRITGISGILNGLLSYSRGDMLWRLTFVLGLLIGGKTLSNFKPGVFSSFESQPLGLMILAGFLVGFGTVMGGGCTSGHGVCGISRLSKRSIVATLIFMGAGMVTVFVMRHL